MRQIVIGHMDTMSSSEMDNSSDGNGSWCEENGKTPLAEAVENGDIDLVKEILQSGELSFDYEETCFTVF